MKNELDIIVFDLETSPQKGYFFGGIWETNIIKIEEWETIICVSYWDSRTNKIKNLAQWDYPGWKKGVWDDKKLVSDLRKIISEFDIVAGQNSDQFDVKVLNSRLIFHGFDPIPEFKSLDTKKIAKSKLKLPSYSLKFIAQFFGLEGKYNHSGQDMWFDSRDGVISAQKEMVKYCNQDVATTRDVLLKLLPFMKHTNQFSLNDEQCPNPICGGNHLVKSKLRIVKGGYKQQYQCMDCGSYKTVDKLVAKNK